jgi:dolichol-phosphate mannosyltransferase
MPRSIALSVPLFNEAPVVDDVVRAYASALADTGLRWSLVLVDNGSLDDTAARVAHWAELAGVEAVYLGENAGYGGGIMAGIRHALARDAPDLIGWGWGDGQVCPDVIPSLVDALQRGADVAKVRRVSRRDGWRRKWVTRSYSRLNRALGTRSPDVNGCPKLMHRRVLEAARLRSEDWFLDPELLLLAEARGWRVVELPAAMNPRAAGRSKVNWRTALSLGMQVCGWHLRNRG